MIIIYQLISSKIDSSIIMCMFSLRDRGWNFVPVLEVSEGEMKLSSPNRTIGSNEETESSGGDGWSSVRRWWHDRIESLLFITWYDNMYTVVNVGTFFPMHFFWIFTLTSQLPLHMQERESIQLVSTCDTSFRQATQKLSRTLWERARH